MTINGNEIRIPEITFGLVVDLQKKKGIDIKVLLVEASRLDTNALAQFMSLAFDGDEKKTVEALDQYFNEGGDFTGILEEINRAVDESGFFQAWIRTMEKSKARPKK